MKPKSKRIPRLVNLSDYYPALLICLGMDDVARGNPDRDTSDCRALGAELRGLGPQVVFCSVLPVAGHRARREGCIEDDNRCLLQWCDHEGFAFFDPSMHFRQRGLLGEVRSCSQLGWPIDWKGLYTVFAEGWG